MAVNFEEPQVPLAMKLPGISAGPVSRFFISLGLARTPKDARMVMLVFACIAFAASVYFLTLRTSTSVTLTPEEKAQVQQELDSVVYHR